MSCGHTVYYYTDANGDSPIGDFINSLQLKARVKVLRIFELIESYGIKSVISHAKKLKGYPIWELRFLGKDSVRLFYVMYEVDAILVLHGFHKKSYKTPQREIEIAIKRYHLIDK